MSLSIGRICAQQSRCRQRRWRRWGRIRSERSRGAHRCIDYEMRHRNSEREALYNLRPSVKEASVMRLLSPSVVISAVTLMMFAAAPIAVAASDDACQLLTQQQVTAAVGVP